MNSTASQMMNPPKVLPASVNEETDTQRLPALDGVRGLGIVMVVFWHYVVWQINPAGLSTPWAFLYRLSCASWTGVDLFFVLSGFLIGRILLDMQGAGNFLGVFYLRRACRILPLYYGLLALYFFVITFLPIDRNFQRVFHPQLPLWPYFCFLQNLGGSIWLGRNTAALAVTWSLAVEEQFYLVLPLLVLSLPRAAIARLMAVVLIISPAIRYFTVRNGDVNLDFTMGNFTRLDGLAWGVLLALAFRNKHIWRSMVAGRNYFLAAWLMITPLALIWGTALLRSAALPFYTSIFAFSYALLIFLTISQPNNVFEKMLSLKWITSTGISAYGIYLLHLPILNLIGIYYVEYIGGLSIWIQITLPLIAIAATWLLANLVNRLIEKPMIAWGHRFRLYGDRS